MSTIEDLQNTIDQRLDQINQLLELTTAQESAIEHGHMNELMRVLGEKQRLIEQFVRLSEKLKSDRDAFNEKPDVSEAYRVKNERCNLLHRELLEREAACQSRLETSRDRVAQELVRGEGARRAAAGYGRATNRSRPAGGGLDLSNDA